jgi:hypothetical protein
VKKVKNITPKMILMLKKKSPKTAKALQIFLKYGIEKLKYKERDLLYHFILKDSKKMEKRIIDLEMEINNLRNEIEVLNNLKINYSKSSFILKK